jgi:hypothetical protein
MGFALSPVVPIVLWLTVVEMLMCSLSQQWNIASRIFLYTMAPKDTFFRSVDMSLIQLYIANENGREVVMALGELSQVQFRDVSWKSDTNYDGSCAARRLMMNLK